MIVHQWIQLVEQQKSVNHVLHTSLSWNGADLCSISSHEAHNTAVAGAHSRHLMSPLLFPHDIHSFKSILLHTIMYVHMYNYVWLILTLIWGYPSLLTIHSKSLSLTSSQLSSLLSIWFCQSFLWSWEEVILIPPLIASNSVCISSHKRLSAAVSEK